MDKPFYKNVIIQELLRKIVPLFAVLLFTAGFFVSFHLHEEIVFEIYAKYFWIPLILASLSLRLPAKWRDMIGGRVFTFMIALILSFYILPFLNCLYAIETENYDNWIVTSTKSDSSQIKKSDVFFKYYLVARKNPVYYMERKVPVNRNEYLECAKKDCRVSFNRNKGWMGYHYISDVKVTYKKKGPSGALSN